MTSTLTPGSILIEVICLTISEGLWKWMSLVDPHLKLIPSFRTLPTGSFSYSDSQNICRHPNWFFHFEILFLCSSEQVSTHLLQRPYVATAYSNSNQVHRHPWFHKCLSSIFKIHDSGSAFWPTCSLAKVNSGEFE